MKTLIRMKELRSVFASSSCEVLQANIARFAVLYEDLRIETLAIAESSIPKLDSTDVRYRRNYFLRRSIATLVELAETLRLLNGDKDFAIIKAGFRPEIRQMWEEASEFFDSNEGIFGKVRNDIAGHFGVSAALYAVSNLLPTAVGKIEIVFDDAHRFDAKLQFAGEIVSTASFRHIPGATSEQKASYLIGRAVAGYRHATRCVQAVTVSHLWEKFGN